ncbi:VOC family protein [Paenibacillus thiaminolyticus]|uniref:VOC family protein n=1 Tax=Paenibacillus thiaminolyticus TaxID=49283 RepID=UPI00232B00B5|nr:VOC family protein [Paenibacillus thiaminolyticus]WCF09546.1 VOC family protein [Paenibacillus thiaminolyticus]
MFERIDTVFVRVPDLEAAKTWYMEVLGLALRWDNDHIAVLALGETPLTLMKTEASSFRPAAEAAFNFYVKDAEAAHRYLQAAGVEVSAVEEGEGVQWFLFQDHCGNALEVCSF